MFFELKENNHNQKAIDEESFNSYVDRVFAGICNYSTSSSKKIDEQFFETYVDSVFSEICSYSL